MASGNPLASASRASLSPLASLSSRSFSANVIAPPALQSPEGVTIHEAGHQFWYGLVANNEFEEAWLDEGFNSYHTEKAAFLALGPKGWGRRYFGPALGRGARSGIPVVAPGVWLGRGEDDREGLRKDGRTDVMARRGWEYRTPEAYRVNSYGKPSLTMQTLEGLVGDETSRCRLGLLAEHTAS